MRTAHQRVRAGLLAAAVCLAAPGSAGPVEAPALEPAEHPLAGRLWDARRGVEIQPDELYRRAIASRFVLLGETHDNPRHHELQAQVLEVMAAAGRRPLVAWEMIDASRRGALAECLARCEDWPRELPDRLDWTASGWPPWPIYAPIAAVAARYRLPLAAANLSADEVRLLAMHDDSDVGSLIAAVGSDAALPAEARASLESTLVDSHCGMAIPEDRLEAMIRVQRGRDRRMGSVLLEQSDDHGAVLIAGSGHTRLDWGAGLDLVAEIGADPVLAVAFLEVSADCSGFAECAGMPAGAGAPWHVVWFTPRALRDDPCEQLRRRVRTGPS